MRIIPHSSLKRLSIQVFLHHIKYYHFKLLAENREFNEIMVDIIQVTLQGCRTSKFQKWSFDLQKCQKCQNRDFFLYYLVLPPHFVNKQMWKFPPATRTEKKVYGDDFQGLLGWPLGWQNWILCKILAVSYITVFMVEIPWKKLCLRGEWWLYKIIGTFLPLIYLHDKNM